jgi:hypothetical protein
MMSFYKNTVSLSPGENHIMLDVPSMSIEKIALKATCGAQLKQFRHGEKSLFFDDQEPIDMSKQPENWYLHAEPPEQFEDGIRTTLIVDAAEPGELTVLFSESAS